MTRREKRMWAAVQQMMWLATDPSLNNITNAAWHAAQSYAAHCVADCLLRSPGPRSETVDAANAYYLCARYLATGYMHQHAIGDYQHTVAFLPEHLQGEVTP